MNSRIDEILLKLKRLEAELIAEVHAKEVEFRYEIRQRSIHFDAEVTARHRQLAKKLDHYLRDAKWLSIITAPVIWSCSIPILLLDLWATVYQFVCFPIYGIPKVRRADYIVMDRRKLAYLNGIEKLNCFYCEYVNGLIAYAQEIAGRTEQYWCPIKHALRLKTMHNRYPLFLDYGDAEAYRKRIEQVRRDFEDLKSRLPETDAEPAVTSPPENDKDQSG
jgi:hypothetical protein